MSSGARRLVWIVLGLVAIVAVGAVAFGIGIHAGGHDGGPIFFRRGFGPGMMGWGAGGGWFGWIPALLLVFVGIFLVVLFLSGDRSYRSGGSASPGVPGPGVPSPGPLPPVNDVERLRQLAELHERGQLTDEEFAAAKRKLLGL